MNKERAKAERNTRREAFRAELIKAGISYQVFNNDLHWRLTDYQIDLWPTSGKTARIGGGSLELVTPKRLMEILSMNNSSNMAPAENLIVSLYNTDSGEIHDVYSHNALKAYIKAPYEVLD